MKYYKITNKKIELTEEGKKALETLQITLEELKNYPDEKLKKEYWIGCKTFVDQALKNGKGITWLDDVRVPYESEKDMQIRENLHRKNNIIDGKVFGGGKYSQPKETGRFPANLLCSDDVLNDGRITKATQDKTNHAGRDGTSLFAGDTQVERVQRGDSGSFSRYFSLDAWWNNQLKKLPKEVQKTFPFIITPKASKSEKNKGLEGFEEKTNQDRLDGTGTNNSSVRPDGSIRKPVKHSNNHPTVKPLKLMSYLVTLGSRENDVVLDPFMGSGTTAIAAHTQGRKFIGFELNEEYVKIAEARIKPYIEQERLKFE